MVGYRVIITVKLLAPIGPKEPEEEMVLSELTKRRSCESVLSWWEGGM